MKKKYCELGIFNNGKNQIDPLTLGLKGPFMCLNKAIYGIYMEYIWNILDYGRSDEKYYKY